MKARVLAAALLAVPLPAAAQEVERAWRCWYENTDPPYVACRLDAPVAEAPPPADDALAGYPPLVRTLRLDPARLVGQVVRIPLHAPPIDMRQAERLATAVLCNMVPACRVAFSVEPPA